MDSFLLYSHFLRPKRVCLFPWVVERKNRGKTTISRVPNFKTPPKRSSQKESKSRTRGSECSSQTDTQPTPPEISLCLLVGALLGAYSQESLVVAAVVPKPRACGAPKPAGASASRHKNLPKPSEAQARAVRTSKRRAPRRFENFGLLLEPAEVAAHVPSTTARASSPKPEATRQMSPKSG